MIVFVKPLTLRAHAMGVGTRKMQSPCLYPTPPSSLSMLDWDSGLSAAKYPTAELHLQPYFVFVLQYFVCPGLFVLILNYILF